MERSTARKLAALRAIFGFCAAAALDYGWVRVSDGVEAAAVWIPPGEPEMSSADAERLPELARRSVMSRPQREFSPYPRPSSATTWPSPRAQDQIR